MRLGPGWEDDTDIGPVINKAALEKIHSYTEIGNEEGAKLLTGGEVAEGNGLENGFYYRPTIFGDVEAGMRIAQEEIFGPTTALIPVRDFDEAIRVSNGIRYGLSSSIFTRDVNKAFRAMRDLVAGITYVNDGTIGAGRPPAQAGRGIDGSRRRDSANARSSETSSGVRSHGSSGPCTLWPTKPSHRTARSVGPGRGHCPPPTRTKPPSLRSPR